MRKSSVSSPISKIFIIFLIACLGLIGYGTYMYIQDVKKPLPRNTAGISTPSNDDVLQQQDEMKIPQASVVQLPTLDKQLEHAVKTNLSQTQNETSPDTPYNSLSIVFSSYNVEEKILSLGLTFNINNPATIIDNCSLEIKNETQKLKTVTNIIDQQGIIGCRFNNILLDLQTPSVLQPWTVKLSGNNSNYNNLVSLIKKVSTLEDLNLLNN